MAIDASTLATVTAVRGSTPKEHWSCLRGRRDFGRNSSNTKKRARTVRCTKRQGARVPDNEKTRSPNNKRLNLAACKAQCFCSQASWCHTASNSCIGHLVLRSKGPRVKQ
eukprot:TRINITY_DN3505_c0_g1_i2.p1 TRINITY_DN3505_c0_g1~~TRINITY_DN3505_c0_g1_i2.p1  ORF type:complete len:110 (-),score=0.10 TRINITY_DN3505_c0_g1_i2:141-470(-)